MPEEAGDVAEAVGFVSVDGAVVVCKGRFQTFGPGAIELGETLADETVEGRVGSLLRTTFDYHVDEFDL